MNKYWFKQKTYGYGVTPVSIEGWILTLLLAGVIVPLILLQQVIIAQHILGLLIVLGEIGIIALLFLKLTEKKTSGTLKWRWGNKK